MNEQAHHISQEHFPAQEIVVPVGGYCYGTDIREGFYENKVSQVEMSVAHQPSAAVKTQEFTRLVFQSDAAL